MKAEHYHDDEIHIRALLEESGLSPAGGMALATATIRGLILPFPISGRSARFTLRCSSY